MIGRTILAIAATAAVGCGPAQEPQLDAAQVTKRPNVLFLFADDQRADTIAAWGNPNIRTPNLDRLAAEGFSFRNNYNLGSNSGAVCAPSRAMVNTGLAYFRVANDLRGAMLLPELLGESGYSTFATGKWHNGEESWLRGFQRGQALFFGGMSDHSQVPLVDLVGSGDQRGAEHSTQVFRLHTDLLGDPRPERRRIAGRSTDRVTDGQRLDAQCLPLVLGHAVDVGLHQWRQRILLVDALQPCGQHHPDVVGREHLL